MYVLCASDYLPGSNTAAIYEELKFRGINCGYVSRDFIENNNYCQPIDIAITNNGRCINNTLAKLTVNTGHGNFFLGDTSIEPHISIRLVASESKRRLVISNGGKPEDIFVVGAPRTDFLVKAPKDTRNKYLVSCNMNPYRPVILYAPTYDRAAFNGGTKGFFACTPSPSFREADLQMAEAIKKAMDNINAQLIIRVHKYYRRIWPNLIPDDLQNIFKEAHICSNETEPDSIPALLSANLLITDFSSIVADALPLNIPVIFIEPHSGWKYTDRWHAGKDCRWNLGPVVGDPISMEYCVSNYFCWSDMYEKSPERNLLVKRYIPFFDGKSAERAVDVILSEYQKRHAQ